MTRTRVLLPVALVTTAFVAILASSYAFAGSNQGDPVGPSSDVLGPGTATVHLTIHHSHFAPEQLVVRSGTTVRFVIDNQDPIGHEFIIGDDAVHRRHEAGTEPVHPPRPGEVSIAAGSTAETTFTFAGTTAASDVLYACHLPGHFRYGMSGTVQVVPA